MDIFKTFATDEKKEVEGVWFDLDETSKVKVARRSNKAYQALISQLYERYKRILDQKNQAARDKSMQLTIEAMAKHLLVGWEGLTSNGVPIEYSFEKAKELLAVKDFRELVASFADDTEAFKAESQQEQLGN